MVCSVLRRVFVLVLEPIDDEEEDEDE